jgi:hypothetical protein
VGKHFEGKLASRRALIGGREEISGDCVDASCCREFYQGRSEGSDRPMNLLSSLRAGRRELRRDPRFAAPCWQLDIEGRRLTAVNWSLGGSLVRGELPLDIGDTVAGTLHALGSDGFTFTARLVRKERRGRGLGFAFEEMIPLAFGRMNEEISDFGGHA